MTTTLCVLVKMDYTTPDGAIFTPANTYLSPQDPGLVGLAAEQQFNQCR